MGWVSRRWLLTGLAWSAGGLGGTALCMAAPRHTGGERGTAELAVIVHDMAEVPPQTLSRAKQDVDRIFSRARVRIAWLLCPEAAAADGSRPCPPRPAGGIMLRIVPTDLDYIGGSALGYTVPGPEAFYATVSLPRVRRCVAHQSISAASLGDVLGHAMAHEIAHILLGTNSHSAAGLMQPDWNARALDDASKGRLNLLRSQEARVRDAITRRVRGEAAGILLSGTRRQKLR